MRTRDLAAALFLVACQGRTQPTTPDGVGAVPAATASPTVTTSPPAATPAPSQAGASQDPCAALRDEFNAARRAATGACTSDDGCGVYPIIALSGAEDAADRATATRLRDLAARYDARRCPSGDLTMSAPAAPPSARCVGGRCTFQP